MLSFSGHCRVLLSAARFNLKGSTTRNLTAASGDSASTFCPKVSLYGPYKVEGLKEGEQKRWCRCGLSKTQPWCDHAHKGTGCHSLKWTVPATKEKYFLCGCKHTNHPPFCDGQHSKIGNLVKERQANCANRAKHLEATKICTTCGWTPA